MFVDVFARVFWFIYLFICLLFCQNGQTPLMLAAEQGSLEIVQELIRRGANVNLDDVVSKPNAAQPSVFLFCPVWLLGHQWVDYLPFPW